MDNFKLGSRVTVIGKNVSGTIEFIGKTHFSKGEWFGVTLDKPKGRNNGCIDGQCYFKCPRNYGLFVRKCQLQIEEAEESDKNIRLPKVMYPKYLRNSSPVKARKTEGNTEKSTEVNKSSISHAHRTNTVSADLKDILRTEEAGDCAKVKDQKTEIENNLQFKEPDFKSISKDIEIQVKAETNLSDSPEDALISKRKLAKTETYVTMSDKRKRELDMEMEQLRKMVETVVIEKEIAEEKSEYFELFAKDQTDKCKTLEIEMDKLKKEIQNNKINETPAINYVEQLENKNAILNNALLQLRDLNQNLQQQVEEYKKVGKEHLEEIESLKNIEKSLEETICVYREEVSELFKVLDGMLIADRIIFEITEKKLKSEENIKELNEVRFGAEDNLQVIEEEEETLHEIKSICVKGKYNS